MAWRVLNRVDLDRAFADLTLHAELREADLDPRDRALATELSYGTLRLRGRLDALLARCLGERSGRIEPRVKNLLRLGAYQVLCLSRVPQEVAVSTSVQLAKDHDLGRASGLVNAVLRKFVSGLEAGTLELPGLEADPLAYLRDHGSLPQWLASLWLEQFGAEQAAKLAEVCTHPPPRTIRATQRIDPDALARRLRARRCRYAPRGITGLARHPVGDPGFKRGDFTVQDEASQLVPLLLGAQPGDSVVDCCAAPGTKTVQLAEQVGPKGEVIALDVHSARLALIHQAAQRLDLRNLRVLQRDAARSFDLQGRTRFHGVLVDAPCSGLGTLRRNPDARWRIRPEQIDRCAERAFAILDSAARYVEDDGALVYSVCTCTAEETGSLIARFLETHPGFRIDDPRPFLPPTAAELIDSQGALRTLPHLHGCDGFFAVRLVHA